MRHDGCPNREMKALKLSILENKVARFVRRNSSFVAAVRSIMHFSDGFEKVLVVFFLVAWMIDSVKDMVSSDVLTGCSPHMFQWYIRVAKFLLQHPNIFNINNDIDGKEAETKTLVISDLAYDILFSSWTEEGTLLVRITSQYVQNLMKHNPFHAQSFFKSGRGLLWD